MAKVRTTLTIDEDVLRSAKVKAARTGKGVSETIEDAVRRDLAIGVLEELWERNTDLSEDEAMELALEAQHEAREALRR
jgi:hypothetical protein